MSELYMMVTVTNRSQSGRFQAFYREHGLHVMLTTLASGTASDKTLAYFGLEAAEKAVIFNLVTDEVWKKVRRELHIQMTIDVPGVGIAFTIPLSSVGGKKALNYLTAGQNFSVAEESVMKETKHELLIVIANQGYSNLVMDAARKAKAGGGTVLHAKGNGSVGAQQFLGVTLAEEKDLILIVVRTEMKNQIMRSIMENAGLESKAHSVIFSLPVTATAGLRLMELPTEDSVEDSTSENVED